MTEEREMTDKGQEEFSSKKNTKVYLGKICHVSFGQGGYQDAQFGLSLAFDCKSCGTNWFMGHWDMEPSQYAKWTEEDRDAYFAKLVNFMRDIFKKAKVKEVNELVGIPVEVTFVNSTLKDWRILEEVL